MSPDPSIFEYAKPLIIAGIIIFFVIRKILAFVSGLKKAFGGTATSSQPSRSVPTRHAVPPPVPHQAHGSHLPPQKRKVQVTEQEPKQLKRQKDLQDRLQQLRDVRHEVAEAEALAKAKVAEIRSFKNAGVKMHSTHELRLDFHNRRGARHAILMSEILNQPRALRSK